MRTDQCNCKGCQENRLLAPLIPAVLIGLIVGAGIMFGWIP